jgi:hypothetical protein
MSISQPNNRILRLDSFLGILILAFGLLVFKKADLCKPDNWDQSAPFEISVIKDDATVSTGIPYYYFQKIWIPNKDNFRILTFDKTKFLENSTVNQKILFLNKIRKKSPGFFIRVIQLQLLPEERDEIPVLS